MTAKPKIGISACLLGQNVRYDGTAKLQPHIVAFFADKAELVPVCPESACGLGIPRETIRLEGDPYTPTLVSTVTRRDITAAMHGWIDGKLKVLRDLGLAGFVFKSRSPSCGYDDTPVWQKDGSALTGQGLFAQALCRAMPGLAFADEEMLQTKADLTAFWHKLQITNKHGGDTMQEGKQYYTNMYEVKGDAVNLDRIYALDENRFSPQDYVKLGEIYSQLEGYLPDAEEACWFGRENEMYCLWASWEPPGLQITGHVPLKKFTAWEKLFHELLDESGLPFKKA